MATGGLAPEFPELPELREIPELPELSGVHWRPRADEPRLRAADRTWTATTLAHEVPFLLTAGLLPLLSPVMIPVSVIALVFAWVIPELYAARGAGVLRPPRLPRSRDGAGPGAGSAPGEVAQLRALGLLGDLVAHQPRAVLRDTGFVVETGRLGHWVIGPAGALLVRGRGRRVQCYCVHAVGDDLPPADRIAHLLLALREDESGFATVANLTFSGARWRVARRLRPGARHALAAAVRSARSAGRSRAA
jgi:hypothetical protein